MANSTETNSTVATSSAPSATKNTYLLTGNLMSQSPLATCGATLSKSVAKTEPKPIPTFRSSKGVVMYMPGAGLRSKIRGAACSLMLSAIEEQGLRRFSLKDAQFNRVGGIKSKGAEATLDRAEYNAMVRANPIIGLFGASTPWVKGKAMVGHVSCKQAGLMPMHVEGVRSDIIVRQPELVDFLQPDSVEQYNAEKFAVQNSSALKKEVADLERQLKRGTDEEKAAAKIALPKLKDRLKNEGVVSALMPLAGYLAIPPNTELDNQIVLVGVSEIELGCFIASMALFAEAPVLGAHSSQGAGVVSGEWQVHKTGTGPIGSITIKPFIGLEIDCQELFEAKQKFEGFIRSDECRPYIDESILATGSGEEGEQENE